jgi:hypothetical protein
VVLLHCTDQVTPPGLVSLATEALIDAVPVVVTLLGGSSVNAMDIGAVIVTDAVPWFAKREGFRL